MSNSARRDFVGRSYELSLLEKEFSQPRASLIVLYGRRRVGKTRLITEYFQDKNTWRFDGVEGASKTKQIKNILSQLTLQTGDPTYDAIRCSSWLELFKMLDRAIAASPGKYQKTIFLDELPYMAQRRTELVSALKWIWDNQWKEHPKVTLVLCGSIASFMINQVLRASSLYGRITLELCLQPLSLFEVYQFFRRKKSLREICDLYMFCGGIPEYLLQIDQSESVTQNIARLAFCKDGYFVFEFDRLFKDIFNEESIYRKIVLQLSRHHSLKVPELTKLLKVSAGGGFTDYLDNLESAGFISSIVPWDRPEESKLKRYRLDDEYLLFYFKFISRQKKKIQANKDINKALQLFSGRSYTSWAGMAFERLCLKHVPYIMKALHIDQLVKNHGPYFNRASNTKEGVQIDLLFIRHDPVITLCEMKYHQGLIGKSIIPEIERKVNLLNEPHKTIERILVTTHGVTKQLEESGYFSKVLLIDELFSA